MIQSSVSVHLIIRLMQRPDDLNQSAGENSSSTSKSSDYDEIQLEIYNSARPNAPFYLMNLFAAIVASYGLLINSAAVIIGAMVIAVLLGPIGGIGYALISGEHKELRKSFFTLVTGALEVFAVSYLIGLLHSEIPLSQELLSRTQPGLFDLIVALAGGAAGAYSIGRRVAGGALIGVAIATALVPPLSSAAIALAHHRFGLFQGAILLFFTNLLAIQCAYSIVLYALRFSHKNKMQRKFGHVLRPLLPSIILLILLGGAFIVILERRVKQEQLESRTRGELSQALAQVPGAYLGDVTFVNLDSSFGVLATVRSPSPITPSQVASFESSLTAATHRPVKLTVRTLQMRVANSAEYLYEPDEITKSAGQSPDPITSQPNSSNIRNSDSTFIKDSIPTDSNSKPRPKSK